LASRSVKALGWGETTLSTPMVRCSSLSGATSSDRMPRSRLWVCSMRGSLQASSERCSSPVRMESPLRLPFTGRRGASAPMETWGTSSSPSIVSITAPLAPVRRWLRSAITCRTVCESSPAAATACCTSMTAWNSSVSIRISASASFRSVMSNSVPR
jgi:hypothetical protein